MSISADSLSAVRRASQVSFEQLSERQTLNCGIAFYSHRFPKLPWANQVREVVLPPGWSMPQAFEEVEQCYAELGLHCHRWVPAATQTAEPIEAYLTARGYAPLRMATMLLARSIELTPRQDVRILPARAMRKAYRESIERDERNPDAIRDAVIESSLDRLDDPQFDMFVALVAGTVAGRGALFQVGDIARIDDLFVIESFRGQGVGISLMAHLLALTRRLAMRLTCLELREEDQGALAFYGSCGFDAGPSYVQFQRAAWPDQLP